MDKKYLPLGTVCRLKNGQKNLMIIGFATSPGDKTDVIYDYMGVFHPEGFFSPDINILFNHDQIEEILFSGLVNDEVTKFNNRLNEFVQQGTIDGQVPDLSNLGNNAVNDAVVQTQQQPQNVNVAQPQMFTGNNQ